MRYAKDREKQFRRELVDLVQRHMPWPYSDVDRDGEEARETAIGLAVGPATALVNGFNEILVDAQQQGVARPGRRRR